MIRAALALGRGAPAAADVTITQATSGKGLGRSGATSTVTGVSGPLAGDRSAVPAGHDFKERQ